MNGKMRSIGYWNWVIKRPNSKDKIIDIGPLNLVRLDIFVTI